MPASFDFPDSGTIAFGRRMGCTISENTIWGATQYNRGPVSGLIIARGQDDDDVATSCVATEGCPHGVVPAATDQGGACLVWNEALRNGWGLGAMTMDGDGNLLLPPAAIYDRPSMIGCPVATSAEAGTLVAWSERTSERFEIRAGYLQSQHLSMLPDIPIEGDACRVDVCSAGGAVYAVWDEAVGGQYQVVAATCDGDGWRRLACLSNAGERWFCPRVAASKEGDVWVTWVVLQEADDMELGIADHIAFGMLARLTDDGPAIITDPQNHEDPRRFADMREGLLASRTYLGYHGLRRNPQLSVDTAGVPWVFWEVRLEDENDHVNGHLAARPCIDERPGACRMVLDEGLSHAVAPRIQDGKASVAFFRHGETGRNIPRLATVDVDHARPYAIPSENWARWTPVVRQPPAKPKVRRQIAGRKMSLFWADTHCHGVFSPDAEGEPDELIRFGRDLAGLDVICVIDNDYYPHKILSEAEWQAHQEYCRHFTEKGRFVALPGWEFTYHREDLTPTFNHRCVIYPRPGGKLFRRTDELTGTDTALFKQLAGRGAMCYPHHCTYQVIDPELDWNVEVTSSWRICLEETDFTVRQLQAGARFGFVGSSDSHRSVPGLGGALTGIFAAELTPESLFEAYRARRTFATQGFMMDMDFRIGDLFIGEEGSLTEAPVIRARCEAPEKIERIEILRDGDVVAASRPGDAHAELEKTDRDASPGDHWYMLRIRLDGDAGFNSPPGKTLGAHTSNSRYPHNLCKACGVFAWSSPIWVHRR